MNTRKRQILLILAVFAAVVVLDQVSKAYIRAHYDVNGALFRESTLFWISHQRNEGLVGGMFSGNRLVAIVAPMAALSVLVYLSRHLDPASRVQSLAYGLVTGGAIGNLIDRVVLGYVTDFLQFHFYFVPFDFPWKYYPAFNVADIGICTGVFMLVVSWNLAPTPDDGAKEDAEELHVPHAD